MDAGRLRQCTIVLRLGEGGAAPSEFRIWKSGENPNRNYPPVLFDAQAAEQVMTTYREHGVDIQIDLEHLSLDDAAPNYDPDSRGWCELEVRNGELWAVNVRWTPDGARRLHEQTQRFVSPTWLADENERPTRIINIALVAKPATDHAMPLAAKTRPTTGPKGSKMKIATLHKVATRARALSKAGVEPSQILKLLADGAADGGGDSGGTVAGVDIAALADFLEISIDPSQDPAGFVKAILAKLDEIAGKLRGDSGGGDSGAPAPADAMPASEVAAAKLIVGILGAANLDDGVIRANAWRAIVTKHEEAAAKLAKDAAAIALTEKLAVVKEMQDLLMENPHTSGLAQGKLCDRLANEPIESMRERVASVRAARGAVAPLKPGGDAKTASGGLSVTTVDGRVVALSAREVAMCAELKVDPKDYAATKKAS